MITPALKLPYQVTGQVRLDSANDAVVRLCVYERSETMCTEAKLHRGEVIDLIQALLAWVNEPAGTRRVWPDNWPPKVGEVWRDSRDEVWAVMATGKLVPLANDVDDHPRLWPADEVESKFGPMVRTAKAWDGVPF